MSLTAAVEAVRELERREAQRRLAGYRPYPKQAEFHAAGATHRERLLSAGNQQGKTFSGACEAAFHLTGEYPEWWTGRRFTKATVGWIGGVTYDLLRDSVQKLLLGGWSDSERGTGTIPKASLLNVTAARGVAEMADTIYVRHRTGGTSMARLKAYEQGRQKWQAGTVDWCWMDEEPPAAVYTEALSRTNATKGMVFITFTPLLGMSEIASRFFMEDSPDRCLVRMTIEDAEHIAPEERERIIRSYRPHEVEARVSGMPALGSGRVFPVAQEAISIEPFEIPKHWPRICGVDFGWDHPAAACWLAHDRDSDTIYVYDAYRAREQSAAMHAQMIRTRGAWIPVAWPADGHQHDKGSGEALAAQYRQAGANMLHEHATHPESMGARSSVSLEAGVDEMLTRMQSGRFRVFSHLVEWWQEFLLYHRVDGQIVKERDDLLSATRYAMMMIRHARTQQTVVPMRDRRGSWMVR